MDIRQADLKSFLDEKVELYNTVAFIEKDPISIPHLFSKKEDIEIAGFLAATIAWGQRATIVKNALRLIRNMDHAPYDFVMNFKESDLSVFRTFVHRTFNGDDCKYFLWTLKNMYQKYGTLESAFCNGFDAESPDTKTAILLFRERFFELDHLPRTQKHVANPQRKSAAKRINMFLRWMVRKDEQGVDFGIWKKIKPSQLICPLDVHSGTVARKMGLLTRNVNDWQAAKELSEALKRMDDEDPVKYDFALFGLGIYHGF